MHEEDINKAFAEITAGLDEEYVVLQGLAASAAWHPEPRPVPEGLEIQGIPPGHIANMGDFDQDPSK